MSRTKSLKWQNEMRIARKKVFSNEKKNQMKNLTISLNGRQNVSETFW